MSDPTSTSQITHALSVTQDACTAPGVVRTSAAGKALQSVGQSSAIAFQDATEYLRNVSTMSTTALGVALGQLLTTGDTKYADAVKEAHGLIKEATVNFEAIGLAAANVMNNFPSS